MRPSTLFLLLLALAGIAVGCVAWRSATEESRAWAKLLEYDDHFIHDDDPDVEALFARFGGAIDMASSPSNHLKPWRLYRLSKDGSDERVLLIRWAPLMMIPGSDSYRIDLAAPGRDVLGSWTFSGANRTWAERAVFERRPDGTPCFVFDSKAAIGGTRHRHIYSLDGDEFVLIRLEDEYGRLRKNTYGVNAHLVGPKPRLRTYEDCERALRSGPVAVLAELTLLGGHHNESNRKDNASPALDHPGVRARVLELRKSDDPWIREAAEAVPLPAGR